MLLCVLVTQWCPTLCSSMDCNPPGSFTNGISQQEYWSGLPFPSPGYLPNPGIEPGSPTLQADSTVWATKETYAMFLCVYKTSSEIDTYNSNTQGSL